MVPSRLRAALEQRRARPVLAFDGSRATLWRPARADGQRRDGRSRRRFRSMAMPQAVAAAGRARARAARARGERRARRRWSIALVAARVAAQAARRCRPPSRTTCTRRLPTISTGTRRSSPTSSISTRQSSIAIPRTTRCKSTLPPRGARSSIRCCGMPRASARASSVSRWIRRQPPRRRASICCPSTAPERASAFALACAAFPSALLAVAILAAARASGLAEARGSDRAQPAIRRRRVQRAGVSDALRTELERRIGEYNFALERKYAFPGDGPGAGRRHAPAARRHVAHATRAAQRARQGRRSAN